MFKNVDKEKIKKLVLSNTKIFIEVTLFATAFKFIFGSSNVLIGVATFISMLMYLDRDLTTNLFKNFFTILFMNIGMGVVVFISTHNLLIGIPLNFLMFFAIGYLTCNEFKRPVYVPFILQFIFLYNFPVPDSKEWIRLVALFAGAVLIMVPQIVTNRNRIRKNSIGIFEGISQMMKVKVDLILEEKDCSGIDDQIRSLFATLKSMIFDTRGKEFYISNEGEASLSLLAGLEKLNSSLTKRVKDFEGLLFFRDIYFNDLVQLLAGKMKVKEFNEKSTEFIKTHTDILSENREGLQILNSIALVSDSLKRQVKGEYKVKENIKEIPEKIKNLTKIKIDTKNVLGLSYATRISIGMTITFIIISIIKTPIEESVWMMFTIYSLVNPIYETAKYKTRDRFISTILGAALTILLLSIFKTGAERTIIILIDGYIMCYMKQYKYVIFFATICIVGMAAGDANVLHFALERVFMVICGIVLAIILNRFVLRCDLEKLSNRLINKYMALVDGMFRSIRKMANNQEIDFAETKRFFLLCAVIENQLRTNYQMTLKEFDLPCFSYNSILTSDLYVFYLNLEKGIKNKEFTKFVSELVEKLANDSNNEIEKDINLDLQNSKDVPKKLMYSLALNISELSENIKQSKELGFSS
ncbi:MAG: FUSC family protein [Clostridium sp.]